MKRSVKKLIPFACGVGVLACAVTIWTYAQWHDTQTLFFDTAEQTAPSTALSPSADTVGGGVDSAETSVNDVLSVEEYSAEASPQVAEPVDEEVQILIDEAVAQLYVYQSEFLSALEALYASAKEEYYALPAEERTTEMKESIMLGYAIEGAILESNCDSLVLSLLVNLTSGLEKLGASVEIVDQMQASYVAQKTEKKAEYMAILES